MSEETLPQDEHRVVRIDGLSVEFSTENGIVHALEGLSYSCRRGEILALVGESGSGKSVSTHAILRLLPKTATQTGIIELNKLGDLSKIDDKTMRRARGNTVSMVFQDPSAALNPVYRVGNQMAELLRVHHSVRSRSARARCIELLARVGLPNQEEMLRAYPHQLSGGQKQRVMIAMAIALDPALIIADEPTTALDVTVQAEILDLLRELRDGLKTAIIVITHNMGVVADLADRVLVLRDGKKVEEGDVRQVLLSPAHEYTRKLLASVPEMKAVRGGEVNETRTVLELESIDVEFRRGITRPARRAVQGVSLRVSGGGDYGFSG